MSVPRADGPRVCILGAGTSGVICAKVFLEQGVAFDCFEKGSGIGGLWRFHNDNGMSTCYRSLHINTGKRMMVLSDYPFPDHVPEYPSHEHILEYFQAYADHFGVMSHVTLGTEVRSARRAGDGTWAVEIEGPDGVETRHYDALVVANGHHWCPRFADLPGTFDGIQMHAHHYVDPTEPHDLRGKRVVVLGMGNSAMDIACELSRTGLQGASTLYLAQRSGVWIVPKLVGNIPQDSLVRHPMVEPSRWEHLRRRYIPRRLRLAFSDVLAKTILNLTVGRPSRVGLKDPTGQPHERHPTISHEIHNRLIHGDIEPRGTIVELLGDRVRFEDGSVEEVDAIIHCTGYRIRFPFFDEGFLDAPDNSIPLWQRMIDPRYPELMFLALVQPLCAMMPIAELQSHFLASYLRGECHLPSPSAMEREMVAYDRMMKGLYTDSPSHTIQIDCPEYTYYLREAWNEGRARARRAGGTLPVPRRAAEPARAAGAARSA